MAVFNEPTKWAQSLGATANADVIPDEAGAMDVDISKIFPAVFSVPLSQGGKAIPRRTLNGIFKTLGDWVYYIQNGGIASYSNTFDYAVGSFVKFNNEFYRCIKANGTSTEVKAPTETAYWSKITTLADVANAFANQDLSNLSSSGQTIIDNKANISFSNINNAAHILMAHNAMPSATSDNLTPVNDSYYTAPADGFYTIMGTASVSGQYIALQGRLLTTVYAPNADSVIQTFLPCSKGESVRLSFSAGTINRFTFVYANGSESEQ